MLKEKVRMVIIQRSRGYSWRRALSVEEIRDLISFIKDCQQDVICFVDNCYGEFVEAKEPTTTGC
ncbi:MAG: methionine gamma-lyase family protein [Thermoanaerobacterales bacterium]|nr:methionine gamma-lyase family protein [Thermoanaerobacterales bacterium]